MTIAELKAQIRPLLVRFKYKVLGRYHPLNPEGKALPKISYSQAGEDCIVALALHFLGIARPSYLDIGAHHPTSLSNTYMFYRKGCRGVCIEPDPKARRLFRFKRRRDVFLNVAVSLDGTQEDGAQEAEFYLMRSPALSTLSRDSAMSLESVGEAIKRVIKVPLLSINTILEQHLPAGVHFVSLDVEGADLEILKAFPLHKTRPLVFCVETLQFEDQEKVWNVTEFMLANGYFVFGETWINTIYVDCQAWERRS